MNKNSILLFGHPELRQKAAPVTVFHKKLHALLDNMRVILNKRNNGAALAAPQIGKLKRVIVIDYEGEYLELINPVMLEQSGQEEGYEGCLSLPGLAGIVKRAATVSIKYQDRNGVEKTITRQHNMARCIQHEMDHLEGILYIDRMEENYLIEDETDIKRPIEEFILLAGANPIAS